VSEIVSIDRRPFRLRDPWTREQLVAGAEAAQERKPFLCRRGRHHWEVVGDVHIPEASAADFNSLVNATLALVATTDTAALTRCERCGAVRIRNRWPA
jgi:hypothetical protein